jgi:hypothetical protein
MLGLLGCPRRPRLRCWGSRNVVRSWGCQSRLCKNR